MGRAGSLGGLYFNWKWKDNEKLDDCNLLEGRHLNKLNSNEWNCYSRVHQVLDGLVNLSREYFSSLMNENKGWNVIMNEWYLIDRI